jgi:hypothetical protein
MRRSRLLSLSALLSLAAPAFAGIADSPLPELLPGATTYHLYSVPGVIGGFTGLATFFSCTSTDTVPMQVGVEIFPGTGGAPTNDAVTTSLSIPSGATRIFGTSTAVGISVNSNVTGTGSFSGSARILATSKKLVCTAFIADRGNDPPISMAQLTIIAKLKQKAAN